jgi:cysteine desulfurase/selenocysteine lyase
MNNPLDYRDEFLITKEYNYLDNAGLSPLPTSVIEESTRFMEERSRIGAMNYFDSWEGMRNRVASGFGSLINAHPDELAFTKNTHDGINMVVNMVEWEKGDNVILNDLEFPANAFPWAYQRKQGVEIRVAESTIGGIYPEDIEALIDDKTKVISLSHVAFLNGFKQDIEAIGKIAKENDVLFVVDAMQSVGVVDFDVRKANIDFLACGGHKWLLAPLGTGFFYIRRELLDQYDPPSIGLQGHDSGLLKGFTMEWNPHKTARKFMTGNINYAGFAGMERGLEIIHEIGLKNIEKRVHKLTDQLVDEITNPEVSWKNPLDWKYRSSTLNFTHPRVDELLKSLEAKKIIVAPRWSGLRVSPNFYNTEEEITSLAKAVNGF